VTAGWGREVGTVAEPVGDVKPGAVFHRSCAWPILPSRIDRIRIPGAMRVNGQSYRTVWMEDGVVWMIDQNRLPFEFSVLARGSHGETADAIRDMTVRGAPAIGAAAAFGLAQGFLEANRADPWLHAASARDRIHATRPTARDLFAGLEAVWEAARAAPPGEAASAAVAAARAFADASVESCRRIGEHGAGLLREGSRVMTHCNAGWLATVDYGTALAPVYVAAARGIVVQVWTCETRPRAQGGRLTAWELGSAGIPHALLADTAAASLMSRGMVDLVIVGADRITANGDVVNKVGTLERAICAKEFDIPFYVAAPPSTFDASLGSGDQVEIEERSEDEVHWMTGPDQSGAMHRVRVTAPGTRAVNPAFDLTPARYVTGYITDSGVFTAPPALLRPTAG
jgi:methylthioribose-1-phosphate isomerase